MAAFQAEEYKKKLKTATSIDDCEKVPIRNLEEGDRYVFISYSHRDFQQVYADLADLYDAGVPFWYDRGLPAGRNWDDVVREKMTDAKCGGVIFYLSENLFLSQSIQTEIHIACGEDGPDKMPWRKVSYFSVNLTSLAPTGILRKVFASKQFVGVDDEPEALRQWMATLTKAFPDKATYLPYSAPAHQMDMVEQINLRFSIKANKNPYDFGCARFIIGNATIVFENGSKYEGEFQNGHFDGHGKLIAENGYIYYGEWKNGERHGIGTGMTPDGTYYEGEWQSDQIHGKGKIAYVDGSIYEGYLNHSQITGQGKYTSTDGTVYVGDWKNGQMHGRGKIILPDNFIYEGDFRDGQLSGRGKMILPDNSIYEGDFQDGQLSGHGKVTSPGNFIYEGDIKNFQIHGCGKMTLNDGSVYKGNWTDGNLNGEVIITKPDGTVIKSYCDNNLIELLSD